MRGWEDINPARSLRSVGCQGKKPLFRHEVARSATGDCLVDYLFICPLMSRPAFDDIYMELAVNLARRSHCIKRHVGAVLTKDTRIISIGYNGPPSGTHNCDEEWPDQGCPRDSKGGCSLAIHAEQNAILYAVKNKTSVEGATLYITLSPCLACARIIFSMGINRVIYLNSYAEHKGLASDEGVDFLVRFGVEVERYRGSLTNVTHMI